MIQVTTRWCERSVISDSRAREPPSPRLSARMITLTYLTVTSAMMDQNTIDRMPKMLSGVMGMGWCPLKISFRAYRGLVPMSPKTTPMAPITTGARAFWEWALDTVEAFSG